MVDLALYLPLLKNLRFRQNICPSAVFTKYDRSATFLTMDAFCQIPFLSCGFSRTVSPISNGGNCFVPLSKYALALCLRSCDLCGYFWLQQCACSWQQCPCTARVKFLNCLQTVCFSNSRVQDECLGCLSWLFSLIFLQF